MDVPEFCGFRARPLTVPNECPNGRDGPLGCAFPSARPAVAPYHFLLTTTVAVAESGAPLV
jgi:hypothetical protein